jgi:protein-L-isoaspartate(D-aspartate) O-methyltransferase
MMMMNRGDGMSDTYMHQRQAMIDNQIINKGIKSKRIVNAFLKVPRHLFVNKDIEDLAYQDCALPIDCQQTISQPYIVALMTDLLDLKPSDSVLELGTGSGYQTAILSCLSNLVYTVELIPDLQVKAKNILDQLNYNNILYHVGNGYNGWKAFAPYDKIIVTAAAESLPEHLIEQLKDFGKLIIPIGNRQFQSLYLYEKNKQMIKKTFVCYCRFVELINQESK